MGKGGISLALAILQSDDWRCGRKRPYPEGAMFEPMREYLKIPSRVEVVRAREVISTSRESWGALPDWVGECYERGGMVISATGVTVFNGPEALRAQSADFIVRDHRGIFSVCDETAFEQNFVPAHSAEVFKLHAA